VKTKLAPPKISNLESWRVKTLEKTGPAGVALLADMLNWDMDQVDSASFGRFDFRLEIIRAAERENSGNWRTILKSIQLELRQDILGVIEGSAVPEDELLFDGMSPRQYRFWVLLDKINHMTWHLSLGFGFGRWSHNLGKEGFLNIERIHCEFAGEKFMLVERVSRSGDGGIRQDIYGILRVAIKIGEISKLRMCARPGCEKFFLKKRTNSQHCSEACRTSLNNKARTGYFRDTYMKRKNAKIALAKRLLKKVVPTPGNIRNVTTKTGLTQKALERAGLI
jgi:hypothetical protein